jgi:chromosome segregation ATPase
MMTETAGLVGRLLEHERKTNLFIAKEAATALERLSAERDEWKVACQSHVEGWSKSHIAGVENAEALEQAQARIAELERELACWKFNTRDDRRLAEDWERHVARIAELEEKIENLEMAIAAYKIAAPTPQGEIVEEKCPCGSHPFAFNFEPGDGEITCAWCGRNMN